MSWLARADKFSFPTKFVITFVCAVFGIATTVHMFNSSTRRTMPYDVQSLSVSLTVKEIAAGYNDELADVTASEDGVLSALFTSSETSTTTFRQSYNGGWYWGTSGETTIKGKPDKLYFTDPENGWAHDNGENLWRTRDGGAFWEKVKLPARVSISGMAWASPEVGFIAGNVHDPKKPDTDEAGDIENVKILRTRDGGRTWRVVGGFASGLAVRQLLAPTEDNLLANIGGFNLMSSSDGGANWVTLFTQTEINSIACDKRGNGWMVSSYGELSRLREFGAVVERRYTVIGEYPETEWRAVDMTPAGAGVLVGENRAFAYTHNSGETWQKVDLVAAEADRVPYFQDLTNARLYGDIAIFQANNRVFMVELPSAAPPQPPKPTAPQILRSGAIRK